MTNEQQGRLKELWTIRRYLHDKLDLSHLAFYRAWLQGIDLREAADRYLDEGVDLREAKSTLAWIREALVRAARRHGRLDYARLLRIKLPDTPSSSPILQVPTLDEYREMRDPDGFYTESDLLALYLEEYPEASQKPSPKEMRLQRLRERQIEAMRWAEHHLATAPMPTDSVVDWFDMPIAASLVLAQVHSLGELCDRIRRKLHRWHVGIRGIGQTKARRIVNWLKSHEATLGAIPVQAIQPARQLSVAELARQPVTDIVPIESLSVPSRLSGEHGENRAARPRIGAENDLEAIHAWLKVKAAHNGHTLRSYRREAERLLLWAILERRKALSSLTIEDVAAYRDWLAALGRMEAQAWTWRIPQERWIGKRNTPRWSTEWRPFEGALSLRSQRQTFVVLKSMCEWLVDVRYLDTNPFDGVAPPRQEALDAAPDVEMSRAFTRGQWRFLMEYLYTLPVYDRVARLRFVLPFAYATGLRLSELVDARAGQIYSKPLRTGLGVRWMLKVLGKGQKWRSVPMPSSVMDALKEYLAHRGLPTSPTECDPQTPLIAHVDANDPVSASLLYKEIKRFFTEASWELHDRGHKEDAETLAQASTHWLRHTRGVHSAETMSINLVQRLLGHASLATTAIYTLADEESLYLELEKNIGEFAIGSQDRRAEENKNNVATHQNEEKEETSNLCGPHS